MADNDADPPTAYSMSMSFRACHGLMAGPSSIGEISMSIWYRFVEAIFLVAVAVWVGAIVMLSFVAAPTIFDALPREQAGDLMNQLFPPYYRVGTLCGLVAIVAAGIQAYVGRRWGTLRFWFTGLMLVSTLYAGFIVTPHAQKVRAQLMASDQAEASSGRVELEEAFRRDHQRAVVANGVALISGLGVLWVIGLAERRSSHDRPVSKITLDTPRR